MNKLYQGDNLAILRSLPDASVDLICTDPPFNTGRDWGAFDDRWEGGLDGYLKFMKPRLIECRRVLKDTGSLYLHCDPTASHYLKVMLDSVFGIKQFRNEIVWCYDKPRSATRIYKRTHDTILFYTKGNNYYFDLPIIPNKNGEYKLSKKRVRADGSVWAPKYSGKKSGSWWIDVPCYVQTPLKERTGFPTQKPLKLYDRIIKASSNQSDIVLDPFSGSGTTLDAAHTLGRQWIGIDSGDEAINVIQGRLRDRHGLEYDRDYQLIT